MSVVPLDVSDVAATAVGGTGPYGLVPDEHTPASVQVNLRGQRSHSSCQRWNACVCRDSDISSSVTAVKPRMKDYDTGAESGDDLEEEDFSMWVSENVFPFLNARCYNENQCECRPDSHSSKCEPDSNTLQALVKVRASAGGCWLNPR